MTDTSPDSRFTPPGPTIASRIPSLRSKGSYRGRLYNTASHRTIVYESKLEADVAYVTLARNDVLDLWDQPPPIAYLDQDGVLRRETVDYLATMADGRRIAIWVKPADKAARMDLKAHLALVAPQIPKAFATHVTMMTEADVPRDAVRTATLIHAVRRTPNGPADTLVAGMVAALLGSVTVGDLVAQTGMRGEAFRAVVRQIADGALKVVHGSTIRYDTVVAPTVVHAS